MFRWALACGFPHPRLMLEAHPSMTSMEVTEAMAYSVEEPYGEAHRDMQQGTLAAMYYNSHRDKDAEVAHWYDFFPNGDIPPAARAKMEERYAAKSAVAKRTVDQQNRNLLGIMKAFNVRFITGRFKTSKMKKG